MSGQSEILKMLIQKLKQASRNADTLELRRQRLKAHPGDSVSSGEPPPPKPTIDDLLDKADEEVRAIGPVKDATARDHGVSPTQILRFPKQGPRVFEVNNEGQARALDTFEDPKRRRLRDVFDITRSDIASRRATPSDPFLGDADASERFKPVTTNRPRGSDILDPQGSRYEPGENFETTIRSRKGALDDIEDRGEFDITESLDNVGSPPRVRDEVRSRARQKAHFVPDVQSIDRRDIMPSREELLSNLRSGMVGSPKEIDDLQSLLLQMEIELLRHSRGEPGLVPNIFPLQLKGK